MQHRTQAVAATRTEPHLTTNSANRTDFLVRLERAAGAVEDHRDALRASLELRDELVTEAHDTHAMSTTAIARAAGLAQSRVVQILAAH